uniref:Uncharacterized protein n=1 Tax=Triticum urartu TaxID=4572 RepID=A0A8R7UBP1_TRIUA
MLIRSNFFFHLEQVHFRLIIASHTDTNLGDWSFLDTCCNTKNWSSRTLLSLISPVTIAKG